MEEARLSTLQWTTDTEISGELVARNGRGVTKYAILKSSLPQFYFKRLDFFIREQV